MNILRNVCWMLDLWPLRLCLLSLFYPHSTWSIGYGIPTRSGTASVCPHSRLWTWTAWKRPWRPPSCLPHTRVLITAMLDSESRQAGPFSDSFIFPCFIPQPLHTLPRPEQKCFKGGKRTPPQEALNPALLLSNDIPCKNRRGITSLGHMERKRVISWTTEFELPVGFKDGKVQSKRQLDFKT